MSIFLSEDVPPMTISYSFSAGIVSDDDRFYLMISVFYLRMSVSYLMISIFRSQLYLLRRACYKHFRWRLFVIFQFSRVIRVRSGVAHNILISPRFSGALPGNAWSCMALGRAVVDLQLVHHIGRQYTNNFMPRGLLGAALFMIKRWPFYFMNQTLEVGVDDVWGFELLLVIFKTDFCAWF